MSLRRHLESLVRAFPDAEHHVIGHSHGGNVALYAVRPTGGDEDAVSEVNVISLATPFLVMTPRKLPSFFWWVFALTMIFSAFLALYFGVFSLAVLLDIPAEDVLGTGQTLSETVAQMGGRAAAIRQTAFVTALALIPPLGVLVPVIWSFFYYRRRAGVAPLTRLVTKDARRVAAEAEAALITPESRAQESHLAIHAFGDEPSALLGASQLASWMWLRSIRIAERYGIRLYAAILALGVASVIVVPAFGGSIRGVDPDMPQWIRHAIGWPALFMSLGLVLVVIVSPIAVLSLVMSNAVFGVDGLHIGLWSVIRTAPAPPGMSTIRYVHPGDDTMSHAIHGDPEVVKLIRSFVMDGSA